MERLTFYPYEDGAPRSRRGWEVALARLAAYEDTGLSPEEIRDMVERNRMITAYDSDSEPYLLEATGTEAKHIIELLTAEVEGRLLVPPCKVGDTVYIAGGDEGGDWIDEYIVQYFYCSSRGINRIYCTCGTLAKNFRPKDIGKTVFLTHEEAEARKGGKTNA